METAGLAPASSGPAGGGDIALVRSRCRVYAASWSVDCCATRLVRWRKVCAAFFQAAIMCSICGTALLGGVSHSDWTVSTQPSPLAPVSLANVFSSEMIKSGDGYWRCASCSAHKHHGQFLVMHSPTLQRQILSNDPLNVQMMAMLDVGLCLTRRLAGFMHGELTKHSLLNQPLVRWNAGAPSWTPTLNTKALHTSLMRTNPLMQRYMSVMECEHTFSKLPVVASSYISGIIAAARDRGPLNMNECPMPFVLSTILSEEALTQHTIQAFDAGGLVQRNDHLQERQANAIAVSDLTLLHDKSLSVERLLFPMCSPMTKELTMHLSTSLSISCCVPSPCSACGLCTNHIFCTWCRYARLCRSPKRARQMYWRAHLQRTNAAILDVLMLMPCDTF